MLTATSNTFASFSIAALSAVKTAQICVRQARKDSLKVWAIASHPEAIRTYRTVWNALILACHAAILLGMLSRDCWEWFKRWSDAYVLACQEQPTPAEEVTEPELTPEIEEATPSGYLEEIASIPDFEPTVPDVQVDFDADVIPNPFIRLTRRELLDMAKGQVKGYSRLDTETLRDRLTELHRLG
jgi:hypothetical protein